MSKQSSIKTSALLCGMLVVKTRFVHYGDIITKIHKVTVLSYFVSVHSNDVLSSRVLKARGNKEIVPALHFPKCGSTDSVF